MLWALPRTTAGTTAMGTLPRKNSDASSVDVVTDGFTLSQYRQELGEQEALRNLKTEARIDYTSFGDNHSDGEGNNDINPFSGINSEIKQLKQLKPSPKEFFHRNNTLTNWGERMFEQYRVDAPCTPPEDSDNYQYSDGQLEELDRLRREEATVLEAAKREAEAQKRRAEERAIAAREVAEIQARFRAERARRRKIAIERRKAKHDSKQGKTNQSSSSSKQSPQRPVLESLRQAAAEQNQPILQFGLQTPPSVAQDSASYQAEPNREEEEESIRSDSCYSRDEKAYPNMRNSRGAVREPVFKSFVRRPLSESKDEEISIQLHLGNRKSGGTCAQNCNVFGCATM
mmetsp:Transcript_27986/g.39066  ORF Transcript_27986/g.39066 Transcript_27986/m.39066 type:complete len:344 (+) Transcript_27986:115-1146(+)